MRALAVASLAVILTIAVSGCKRTPSIAAVTGPSSDAPEAVENFGPALTDEDCVEFAAKLEEAVRDNPQLAEGMIDKDILFSRSTSGVGMSSATLSGVRAGFRGASNRIFTQLGAVIDQGGSYHFLRVQRKNDQPHVLFRLHLPEGGLNYHSVLLARQADGVIRAVDLYVLLAGEYMSQTIRRLLLPLAAQEQRGLLDRLAGRDQDLIKHIGQIQRMSAAVKGGKHEEGLRLFDQLPASLQDEKCFRLLQVLAASKLNEEKYQEVLEQYRALFPDDPGCDLVSVDYFILKKDFDRALQAIDAVDKAVGGDPHLNVTRANAQSGSGNFALAKECAHKALQSDPASVSAYWALANISLKEKDHAETARLLTDLSDKFKIQFNDLTTEEAYKDFVKSPEYREWLESRKGK